MVGDATMVGYSATVASTAIADPNDGKAHDCFTHCKMVGDATVAEYSALVATTIKQSLVFLG